MTNPQSTIEQEPLQAILNKAVEGEPAARSTVNEVARPYIQFQTDKFCRRFCQNQHLSARCTLSPPQGRPKLSKTSDTLCDKANASYGWMLDDLTNERRLQRIRAESIAQLAAYFKTTANSLPFYERWKNWRFDRRVHVPEYISEIDEYAKTVFLQLRAGNNFAMIAQALGADEARVRAIIDKILIELTQRKRLHLLNAPKTVTFSELSPSNHHADHNNTNEDSGSGIAEFEDHTLSPEKLAYSLQIRKAWDKLDDVEQYIVESLVIENQDANTVLKTLAHLEISLKKNSSHIHNDRQQLYYFKRKTLEKLQKILSPANTS